MTDLDADASQAATGATNPYLEGNFAPVQEEVTAFDLPVTGTLPASLDGRYLRNGPNPVQADPATYHWFTGDGTVHGIRLRDGHAEWYRNRWVRSGRVPDALGEPDPGGPRTEGMNPHRTRTSSASADGLRAGRGGLEAGRARRRADDHLALRLRRHAAERVHRDLEGGPGDGRAARWRTTSGATRDPRVRGRRRDGWPGTPRGRRRAEQPDGARHVDHASTSPSSTTFR